MRSFKCYDFWLNPEQDALFESVARKTVAEMRAEIPAPTRLEVFGRPLNAYILKPDADDYDPTSAVVRFAEFGQSISPIQQYIGARITQMVVAPNKQLIMLQNNGIGQSEHQFDDKLIRGIRERGMIAYAEDKAEALELLGIKSADFTGWSMGANTAIETAIACNGSIEVGAVNADELVSVPEGQTRDAKQLKNDFLKSGGWKEQRLAGDDSGLLALQEAFRTVPLAIDYAKFGWATLRTHNSVLHQAMTGSMDPRVKILVDANPDLKLKIGKIDGSLIFRPPEASLGQNVVLEEYKYPYLHATVNQPVIQASLAARGLITAN